MQADKHFMLIRNQCVEANTKLSEKAKLRLSKSKADNTLKAYRADWRDFAAWCAYHGERDLPAAPETIVNYLNDLADDAKANTVARRVTAISENHVAAGYQGERNPAKSSLVRTRRATIRREKARSSRARPRSCSRRSRCSRTAPTTPSSRCAPRAHLPGLCRSLPPL